MVGFKLIGGHPAVDFVNTLGGADAGTDEFLHSYGDLVAWAQQSGLVDRESGQRLCASTRQDAGSAAATLDEARSLRAHVDAVLRAHVETRPARPADLEAILDAYRDALAQARLTPAPPRYRWNWRPADHEPRSVLWPIAQQVADLLVNGDLDPLKTCGACRWLYLDTTRNHSRRWCIADECGVRTRMRRYRSGRRTSRP